MSDQDYDPSRSGPPIFAFGLGAARIGYEYYQAREGRRNPAYRDARVSQIAAETAGSVVTAATSVEVGERVNSLRKRVYDALSPPVAEPTAPTKVYIQDLDTPRYRRTFRKWPRSRNTVSRLRSRGTRRTRARGRRFIPWYEES